METVHVIGAGGIGTSLAFCLARGGWAVTAVEVNAAKVNAGKDEGIFLNGAREKGVRLVPFEGWIAPQGVPILLCTKTYDNPAVLARVPDRSLLIPVQNGFDPVLEGSEHQFEGIAAFVARGEPGRPVATITRPGKLYLGGRRRLDLAGRKVLGSLAAGLSAGGCKGVKVVRAILPYKTSKLMYNAAISPLAAAAGLDNEGLLRDPLAQRLFFALLRENYAILRRSGAALAQIGPFPPAVVDRILSFDPLARALAHLFRPGLRGTYCSMAPDMRTGRTEIGAYNGYLRRLARETECPINTAVLKMMSAIVEKGLNPRRELLVQLGRSVGIGERL